MADSRVRTQSVEADASTAANGAVVRTQGIDASYGHYQVLWGVDLEAHPGEIVAVLGPNGAGKSTVLKAISGLVQTSAGLIEYSGHPIQNLPTNERVRLGISHVLERRRMFPRLTVRENLVLGSLFGDAKRRRAETLRWVESLFPVLQTRFRQKAGSLSGGEQQMVAIARGLMSRPGVLMVDEPTLGLAPRVAAEVFSVLERLRSENHLTILIVEQNVQNTLRLAQRGYVLESGRLAASGTSSELLSSDAVRRVFLGSAS